MMQGNDGAECLLRVGREECFECSARSIADALARNFFDRGDKFGIKLQARAAQRNSGNHARVFGSRRQDARGSPRCAFAGLLAVEESDLQAGPHQFKCNRATDQSAARDSDIKRLHKLMIAHGAVEGAVSDSERNVSMRTDSYREEASSSESTWALVARLRARVQSPSRLADCASPINCLILAAKSDWVAFSFLPCERARFFSASAMLEVICCRAAEASAGDICGAITGASGLFSALFSAAGAGATCGRAGAV